MITSFSAHPKAQNNRAKYLMAAFFAAAIIAVAVSYFLSAYTWILGLVALASITTAILIYTKYVSIEFYYDIIADEEPIFVVRQQVGKRTVTLCRVPLEDIVSITKETREERKSHKREAGVSLYVYAPTMSPETSYRILVSNRYERSEVVLEGTDEFFDVLVKYSAEARANSISE